MLGNMLILTESCKNISEYFIKTSSAVSLPCPLATREPAAWL